MQIIACDQSFQRPGFAVLDFDVEAKQVQLLCKSHVDNKSYQATYHKPEGAKKKEPIKKPHGQILSEIAKEFHSLLKQFPNAVLVREKALDIVSQGSFGGLKSSDTIKVLHKVVGVTDQYAWASGQKTFEEIHPVTLKKLLTGNPHAAKNDIARSLPYYIGDHLYACDDESDAAAVGIGYLIQNDLLQPAALPEDFFPPAPEPPAKAAPKKKPAKKAAPKKKKS